MKLALAPSRINTIEKPITKANVFTRILRVTALSRSSALSSSRETPEINDMYPGTSGSTQGERKEMIPAANAAIRPISVMAICDSITKENTSRCFLQADAGEICRYCVYFARRC